MGKKNSSLTRVKPLLDSLSKDLDKLNRFIALLNRELIIDSNTIVEIRYGENEKRIPPSKSHLIWMLHNLHELNRFKESDVSKESKTYKQRLKLFNGDPYTLQQAKELIEKRTTVPDRAWYVFEGYTVPDIYIETNDSIYVAEAKRTEKDITKATKWLSQRDQLIRHIDALLDQSKTIYSFYILEKEYYLTGNYKKSMRCYEKEDYFKINLKHRDFCQIERAFKSYLGYVFWEDIAEYFGFSFPADVSI